MDIIEETKTKEVATGGKEAAAAGSEVFQEMARRLADDSSVAAKVNAIIQWNVKRGDNSASQWSEFFSLLLIIYNDYVCVICCKFFV